MKRREFLKSTLLFAAVSTVVGKAAGIMNHVQAAVVWVTAGKLGYKEVSPQAKNGKVCATCKHFKLNAAIPAAGTCVLPAMIGAMKEKEIHVKAGAYCNMWAKKV